MGMVSALRGLLPAKTDPATAALYAACVAAARRPVFYAAYGVPDSVDGRFDMLLLHVTLAMLRLSDAAARQRLFDRLFADMDRSLREMGVGDMRIGKKMKPMLAGFYGRAKAYRAALAEPGDEALAAALTRNLYGKDGVAEHAPVIAGYCRACVAALAAEDGRALAEGRVVFPPLA
jgi:cytochrome b pre-mRNA-processing protein 3